MIKASGERQSLEYLDSESNDLRGYFRYYNNDRQTSFVEKKNSHGWLYAVGRMTGNKREFSGKVFTDEGHIKEGTF